MFLHRLFLTGIPATNDYELQNINNQIQRLKHGLFYNTQCHCLRAIHRYYLLEAAIHDLQLFAAELGVAAERVKSIWFVAGHLKVKAFLVLVCNTRRRHTVM